MATKLWALLLLFCAVAAQAAGPRFVTGKPYFTGPAGVPIGWKQQQLLYSTDPADLSATVNHAAADALVAAAAAVWNVPVASITIAQGPALAEHVSAQNVYFDGTGLHFPADVTATSAASIPLAIVYDTDGSVTDTLLGAGASNPSGCRQNAVTESVDAFDPAGYITHAIIVVNGRCTGTAPAAQLQLRYQLQRVFGRVLGLAWSQTNDNVFTGTPTPTPAQVQNWPILHPLDIICGLYTYQCLPNPFTLRTDDIAAMVLVYPIDGSSPIPPGKQLSYAGAQGLQGTLNFPTGEGMAGVNVLVRRMVFATTVPEAWYAVSGVTGAFAARAATSPFVAAGTDAMSSQGSTDPAQLGRFFVPWYPVLGTAGFDDRLTSAEPVNPLYTGEYTLGPYPAGNVQPSGTLPAQTAYVVGAGVDSLQFTLADAAATCGNGADGTPTAPAPADPTGWGTGLICGYGHVAYGSASVRPNRTFTLEVTALDAQGLATTAKLMPVLGLYAATETPPTTPPSLAATVTAFNGLTTGTTTLHAATGAATAIRFGIADQRGDGRPDYPYQSRLFYADSIAPAQIAAGGGTATITGTGFRNGNAVTVNGVAATVLSWSSTAIVVTVPAGTPGPAVDVTVSDRGTGATSTMTAALTYSSNGPQPASMRLVSAPAGTLLVGDAAAVPFAVQLVGPDGAAPLPNVTVSFSGGAVTYAACAGAATCSLRTDANGLASTRVIPTTAGSVTLTATAGSLSQSASFTVIAQASSMNVLSTPESPLRVGIASASPFEVQDIGPDGYHSLPFRAITFSTSAGVATFDACAASPCTVVANYFGQASVSVIPQSSGPITVRATDGDLSQTVTVQALANTDTLAITQSPPTQYYLTDGTQHFSVTLLHADGSPDPTQSVTFTAPAGISFGECANASCPVATTGGGVASVNLTATATGTYTVVAAYGSLTQSVTFTVISHLWQLKVLSVPANGSPTGMVAAAPFKVQVVLDDGVTPAPIAGHSLILGGDNGAVSQTTCLYSACEFWVGADATATAWIIPQQPGPLTLSAIYAPLVATATFTAVGGVRTMQVVSQPANGASTTRESDVSVELLNPDGSALGGDQISFTVLTGPYLFYEGLATFTTGTGGNGIATAPGLAFGYGPVVLQATDGFVTRQISFLAGTPPRVMKLVSTPPSPSLTGMAAARPFAVQVFAQDGVTPVANEAVTFTLTGGAATLGTCASPTCVVTTDAGGNAQVQVTPVAAGVVGLLATDGYVTVPTTFQAMAPPDVLRIASAPANGSFTGVQAAGSFGVQVLLADGTTPAVGHSVVVSVAAGSATLAACAGAVTCTLVSDANGLISTPVTPNSPGTITLLAVDGQTQVSASFSATLRPHVIKLVSAPSGTVGVAYAAATPFTIQILQGDGTTPEAGKSVVFTATQGSVRFSSGSALTAADGTASTFVTPLAAGPVTLVATSGTLTQSASFNAAVLPDVLKITSVPASGGYPGLVSAQPFGVQVYLNDGVTPASNVSITLSVTAGSAIFAACNAAPTCLLDTDSNGLISTPVTPNAAGAITLQAADGPTTVSSTFTVAMRPDTLQLVSAPTGTVGVGNTAAMPFTVRLLQGDGTTPDAGKPITFSATQGSVRFSSGTAITAADGTASTLVTPLAAGLSTLVATSGTLTQSASFNAVDQPPVLRIVSAPASGGYAGTQAAVPFAVKLLAADGTTPKPGTSITFSVAAGNAAFPGCTTPCTLLSDSTGTAQTLVTPFAAGSITLVATAGALSVSATFNAIANQDQLTALNPSLYLAENASVELVLAGQATQNGQPAAAQAVHWTGNPGLQPELPETLTNALGTTYSTAEAGPLAAGAHAQATACAWSTTCATYNVTAVSATEFTPAILSGAAQAGSAFGPVTLAVTDAAGHSIAGAPVSIYQTVTAYAPCPSEGRCPAAAVLAMLATAAATDANGRYTFTPLTVEGQPTETEIAIAAGTSGFTTTMLQRRP